jgi:hypothetical protein
MLTCIKRPRIKPADGIYPNKSQIKHPLHTVIHKTTQI